MSPQRSSGGESRSWLVYGLGGLVVTALMMVVAIPILISAAVLGSTSPGCESSAASGGEAPSSGVLAGGVGEVSPTSGHGEWLATAYGPPWEGINGTGVTATGIDLRPARHAYVVAVDPSVIPLGSYVHVSPNPYGNDGITFLAGDTGSEILGKHVDVYDWRGRTDQENWGRKKVEVTPAPSSGAGAILGATEAESTPAACTVTETGPVPLTPGETAKILSGGRAAAPTGIPGKAGEIVKAIIAAGNEIDSKPYPEPDVHYGPLSEKWPAYDCSGSTSYVLYKAGLHSVTAENSTGLESWGEPGPGKYLTIYANTKHVFVSVAGIAFNTAWYAVPPEPAIEPDPPSDGPRWQHGRTVEAQLNGDPEGFVARHWSGM
jgi:3D (Asp-Asp-Asp) domain-containing protein